MARNRRACAISFLVYSVPKPWEVVMVHRSDGHKFNKISVKVCVRYRLIDMPDPTNGRLGNDSFNAVSVAVAFSKVFKLFEKQLFFNFANTSRESIDRNDFPGFSNSVDPTR